MKSTKPFKPAQIIKVVCEYYDEPVEVVISDRRDAHLVEIRHMIIYLARKHCGHYSLAAIGRNVGRTHASCLHGIRKIERMLEGKDNDKDFDSISLVAILDEIEGLLVLAGRGDGVV